MKRLHKKEKGDSKMVKAYYIGKAHNSHYVQEVYSGIRSRLINEHKYFNNIPLIGPFFDYNEVLEFCRVWHIKHFVDKHGFYQTGGDI